MSAQANLLGRLMLCGWKAAREGARWEDCEAQAHIAGAGAFLAPVRAGFDAWHRDPLTRPDGMASEETWTLPVPNPVPNPDETKE